MPRHSDELIRPQILRGGVGGMEVSGVSEGGTEVTRDATCEEASIEPEDSEARKPQVARRPHTPS